MNAILARLSEPSSYAGLAGILTGLNTLFNLHGVPEAAGAVAQAGAAVATGATPLVAIGTALVGALALLLPEKKA